MKNNVKTSATQEKVKEAEEALQTAKKELDNAYANSVLEGDLYKKIKAIYINSTPTVKKRIRNHLEKIISNYEFAINIPFHPENAKELRKKAGLSLKDLADRLEFGSAMTIVRYEQGEPGRYKKGKFSEKYKKYLLWLKEKGYNPYNLK